MSLIYIQTYSAVYQNRTKKTTSIRQSVYIIPFLSIPVISLHIYLFRACGYNYIIYLYSQQRCRSLLPLFVGWCCPSNKWRRTGNTKNEQFNACQQYIYSSQPKISVHHQEFRDGPEAAQLPCITRSISDPSVTPACLLPGCPCAPFVPPAGFDARVLWESPPCYLREASMAQSSGSCSSYCHSPDDTPYMPPRRFYALKFSY